MTSGKTMKVKKDPSVSGAVVIEGQQRQIFPSVAGRLEMEGVMLSSGSDNQGGGAVTVNSGSASFLECSFTSNSGGQGGAVRVLSGGVSFEECSFSGNTAKNDVSSLLLNS